MEQSADARGLDLVFRNIQSEDEGEYSCEAVIDGRKEQQIFHLKVIGKFYFFLGFLFDSFNIECDILNNNVVLKGMANHI